jgi:hypothetical protein
VKRPTCPAVEEHHDVRVTCIRSRWHRGMHHSAVLPLPNGDTVEVHWIRDWRGPVSRALAVIERWNRIPHVEPIDWGKR